MALPRGAQRLTPGLGRLTNMVFEQGRGLWITTADGRRLLDCTAGIGVTSTGHCHPKVLAAAAKQMQSIVHAQTAIGLHQPLLDMVEKLARIMPHPSLDTFLPCTIGAEAVENAVKTARMFTNRHNLIVMDNAFHGRTYGTMSMTKSKIVYTAGFGPMMSNIITAPFPRCVHCRIPHTQGCCNDPIVALKNIFKMQCNPKETCAILVEPIQGEGGYYVAPPGYLQQLRDICDEHGILLIVDEIQSGMGRTGTWWYVQHENVRPDILCMAKGLGSGFPVAAIAGRAELFAKQPPGCMGGTYTGSSVPCAAACATIDVIEEEGLLKNAAERGEQLIQGLRAIHKSGKYPIVDVRGKGLMVAVEFDQRKTGFARNLVKCAAYDHDLLVLTASAFEVVRFIPALVVSRDEIDECLRRFEAALATMKAADK